ncbi:MAG: transglycosylase SLT domain-containing protein [Methylomonas sp.]
MSLIIIAAIGTLLALGYFAQRFSGLDFYSNLLPFAAGIVSLVVIAALSLLLWNQLRKRLILLTWILPSIIAIGLAALSIHLASQTDYLATFKHFRSLVGGKQQVRSETLAHQIYATYRRYDAEQLQTIIQRAEPYHTVIDEAAKAYQLDPQLLCGLAATESSFLPRDSHDTGHGLFQITAVPKLIMEQTRLRLGANKLSLSDARHNAFIAAATLKFYLSEMHNDLYLGLLAYNIGPRNGGLAFIMKQYGATDFVTMQPYLQQLPRDYPIRVLSQALAFRLWQHDGKLLAYQEGSNANHIQNLGIPGLPSVF